MPKSNTTAETLPVAVELALTGLGAHLALARKRRRLRQRELAAKAGITHVTLRRIERGNPTTAVGAYAAVLWALGLEAGLHELAAPESDAVGQQAERARAPKRVRSVASTLSDEF